MTHIRHRVRLWRRSPTSRYDHLGRRVQKITREATHTYFYDGWMLVMEVVERSGDTRRCGVSPRHCGGAGSSTSFGEDAAGSRVSMEEDVIEYHWGKDLSGTIGGAGGVGGLLYVKINGAIYVPWYDAYGNVMGYWDAQGHIVAEYTYDAFGKLIASSGPMSNVFSLPYSTKYFDPETGFYYYGYRFYSPELKRWITRDPIGEEGGVNLYAMCVNSPIDAFDILGTSDATVVIEGLGAGWAGARVTLNGKTAVRLNDELYYLTMTKPVGTRTPLSGSTTSLFLFKVGNPKKALRIDYHKFPLNSPYPPYWHVNVDGGGIAKVANSSKLNHTTSAKIRGTGRMLTVFKHGEKICFIAGFAMSAIDIYKAENRVRETTRQVVGWGAAYAGGRIGSALGAKAGMATAIALGQAGPQVATPEEVITVPVLGVIGGIGGGLVGGIGGFIFGSNVTGKVYDWAFTPLTKEEWEVGCESK